MARKKHHAVTSETTLYAPVKRYLEALGFTAKGEVYGCDLVALRGDEPPIVVVGELKLAFSLELVLQGVNRKAACERSGLPCMWPDMGDACAIRACTSSAVSWGADGLFRTARECHFDTEPVRSCLGRDANLAVIPAEHASAVRDLYGWLGVAGEPRLGAIVERVQELSTIPHSRDIVQQIQKILTHLGKRVEASDHFSELIPLKRTRWLPARGRHDRWYTPGELYATYQLYLFDTQAIFLDASIAVQNASRTLLQFLGVRLTPISDLVVKHLVYCAEQGIAVNAEVYRFLNERVSEPALVQLRGSTCLWLGDAYYAPNEVFWGEHSFGRYRRRLGEELRSYASLLKLLGVRETPTWEDALAVLHDVVDEFAPTNRPLDQEAHAVLMACWRAIGQALDDGATEPEALVPLHSVKCVPDARRVLNRPDWMFFENRAGLTAKFSPFLTNNVIPRPIGTGHALDAAGVRSLGTAARIELLECTNPVEDVALGERVRSRRNEIGRILEAHGRGYDTSAALDRIDDIRFQSAATIEIRYRLSAFNRELESAPEKVPALYEPDQQTIVFCHRDGTLPWSAISRELAVALFPEDDPGRFAAGFKEALAAESADEAAATLDELGFARLDTSVVEPVSADEGVDALGTSALPGGDAPAIASAAIAQEPQVALRRGRR